jgi:peptidoglycan hydrolase-like protein with peptidoglycan-binding domain
MMFTALTGAAALVLLGSGTASADVADRSFPGCPMLSENHSTGACVKQLQNDLNTVNSGYNLTSDGVFGQGTRIAVLDFQGQNKKHGLGADGLVGAATADLLAQQAQEKGSVPTPTAGQQLTPQERCRSIDKIVYKGDRCISDGAIGSGLSPMECLKEQLGAKAYEEAIKGGASEEEARALAKTAAGKALEKLSIAKSIWDGGKCMFVTNDPEQLKAYESVPMP